MQSMRMLESQESKAQYSASLVQGMPVQRSLRTVLAALEEMEPDIAALLVVRLIEGMTGWVYTLHRWLRDNRYTLRFALLVWVWQWRYEKHWPFQQPMYSDLRVFWQWPFAIQHLRLKG